MVAQSVPPPGGSSPVEPLRVSVAADGTLAAVLASSRVTLHEVPSGTAFAEIGADPDALASEVGWVGTPPRLLVLARYAAYSTAHLLDPHGPRSIAEIRLEAPMRLFATVGSSALVVGAQSAAVLVASEPYLMPYQVPARIMPVAAGAAAGQFVVALAGSIEEWDPQSRMPKRRLRLPRTAAITAVGGSERVVWMTTQQEPARIDVIPLVNRGQPKAHDLPEPIARVTGHPRSDLVACIGAHTGRLYIVDLDGRARLRVIGPGGIDRIEAAALVVGRMIGVLAAQAERPISIVPIDSRDLGTELQAGLVLPSSDPAIRPPPTDEPDEPAKPPTLAGEPDEGAGGGERAEHDAREEPGPEPPAAAWSSPQIDVPGGTPPASPPASLLPPASAPASPPSPASAPASPPSPASAPASPLPPASAPASSQNQVPPAVTARRPAPAMPVTSVFRPPAASSVPPRAVPPSAQRPAPSTAERFSTWRERVQQHQQPVDPVVPAPPRAPGPAASPPQRDPRLSWRDHVAMWSRAVSAGAADESAPAAPAIDALLARFDLALPLRPVLVMLYGAHLCGERGVAPVDVARLLDHQWDEALGRGELARRGVAEYAGSRVALAPLILRVLDELSPVTGTLVGEPGPIALLGPCVVVAGDEPLPAIAARCLPHVGGAILAAGGEAPLAVLLVEARTYGAAPMLRVVASLEAPPADPAILVVSDDELADRLGLPRLA